MSMHAIDKIMQKESKRNGIIAFSILAVLFLMIPTTAYTIDPSEFKPTEIEELVTYFGVHDSEEGPGVDLFGVLCIRLHLPKGEMPAVAEKTDRKILAGLLPANSKYKPNQYGHKFIIPFISNAPWNKQAMLTLFINDVLYSDFVREVSEGDECYLFFWVRSFNTFTMTTEGIVVEFLTAQAMKQRGLL